MVETQQSFVDVNVDWVTHAYADDCDVLSGMIGLPSVFNTDFCDDEATNNTEVITTAACNVSNYESNDVVTGFANLATIARQRLQHSRSES